MEKRKQDILKAVVKEYQKTAQPVSSQILFERYSFYLSPAAIRLEMSELTEEDYLFQPHISAGRVPTDRGYRFFVAELMGEKPLIKQEKKKIEKDFTEMKKTKKFYSPKRVAESIAFISRNLGFNKEDNELYEAGLNWLLKEPEFSHREQLIDLVDSFREIENIFNEMENDLQILIGRKLGPRLKDCSLIARRLHLSDGQQVIGVLGPKRLDYARNISLLDYTSKLLEDLFN